MHNKLIEKYNIAAPRYTSYPTVPFWQPTPPSEEEWQHQLRMAYRPAEGISIYIHLPFCERLCTYCGCNKRITKNHRVEQPYIQAILKEWKLYLDRLPDAPIIKELHLGGGTPTFFAPEHLEELVKGILKGAKAAEDASMSVEVHPMSTTREHLSRLAQYGFNRISIGVQDFDEDLLSVINRPQTYAQVARVADWSRMLGYDSINFDLIFGLPFQRESHILDTMKKVAKLRPERLAFYSYAHVPWISPSQRAYSEADLPKGEQKRALYQLGKNWLEDMGYHEIGLDHFSLPEDTLYQAQQAGQLHRNFMGYTSAHTNVLIGLGTSAISDTWTAYVQNEKTVEAYQARVNAGQLPILRGHLLSEKDRFVRRQILNLMCQQSTSWSKEELDQYAFLQEVNKNMLPLAADGLVSLEHPGEIRVSERGKAFLRNIAMKFDQYLNRENTGSSLFSQAV
ncbi:MAG: oxygen-independent coproporphyrinogen III oxidase [Bacteroidota bacterium]